MNKQFILSVESPSPELVRSRLIFFFSQTHSAVTIFWDVTDGSRKRALLRISLPLLEIKHLKNFMDTIMPGAEAELYELAAW